MRLFRRRPSVDYGALAKEHRTALVRARGVVRAGAPLSQLGLARALLAYDEALKTPR